MSVTLPPPGCYGTVSRNNVSLGASAKQCEPFVKQVFIGASPELAAAATGGENGATNGTGTDASSASGKAS